MAALGKIEKIDDLRSVWPHEALDFSKWLSQEENLALLSGLTAGELASLTITSGAEVLPLAEAPDNAVRNETGDMAVLVQAAKGEKCERCWIYSQSVGQNEEHPTLCARCAAVLSK